MRWRCTRRRWGGRQPPPFFFMVLLLCRRHWLWVLLTEKYFAIPQTLRVRFFYVYLENPPKKGGGEKKEVSLQGLLPQLPLELLVHLLLLLCPCIPPLLPAAHHDE